MSVIEMEAREYWRTAIMLRMSAATTVTRRLALGRALQNQGVAKLPAVSRRFAALAAEYGGAVTTGFRRRFE